MDDGNILFTPASLLDLLSQIDELSGVELSITESSDSLQLTVGSSSYQINTKYAEEVEVSDSVLDEVQDINEDAYDSLYEFYEPDTIETGIIKEIAKTLAVGGLVRLTSKLLKR